MDSTVWFPDAKLGKVCLRWPFQPPFLWLCGPRWHVCGTICVASILLEHQGCAKYICQCATHGCQNPALAEQRCATPCHTPLLVNLTCLVLTALRETQKDAHKSQFKKKYGGRVTMTGANGPHHADVFSNLVAVGSDLCASFSVSLMPKRGRPCSHTCLKCKKTIAKCRRTKCDGPVVNNSAAQYTPNRRHRQKHHVHNASEGPASRAVGWRRTTLDGVWHVIPVIVVRCLKLYPFGKQDGRERLWRSRGRLEGSLPNRLPNFVGYWGNHARGIVRQNVLETKYMYIAGASWHHEYANWLWNNADGMILISEMDPGPKVYV